MESAGGQEGADVAAAAGSSADDGASIPSTSQSTTMDMDTSPNSGKSAASKADSIYYLIHTFSLAAKLFVFSHVWFQICRSDNQPTH